MSGTKAAGSRQQAARDVLATVGLALLGLKRQPRVKLRLAPTPNGILVLPSPDRIDSADDSVDSEPPAVMLEPVADLIAADPNARALAHQAALKQRPAGDHAMALLNRLQQEPETVGAVDYDLVKGVYADLLIELEWAPHPWARVSQQLRAATGSRKRYRNSRSAAGDVVKVLVFDIPDPRLDEVLEQYEQSLRRAA